uniref:Uncharacterized protein n=1 Tax=Setaria viridis TaxID=4556 RepID=A0A4U6UY55_SETVI|nr:uncharacterized protein LOC117853425 [Setaria viridis]TKW20852.1 hypothetical protein SEVIR_4G117100v2 [Setaria viridis]
MGLTETRVEAAPAVPAAAAGARATAPDAAGLVDSTDTCAAVPVEVNAAVVDADAHPVPSADATVFVAAAGAGVPVPAAAAAFITATEVGVPAFVVAAGAGTLASTAAFAASTGVDVPTSTTALIPVAVAGVDFPPSAFGSVCVVVAGAIAPIPAVVVSAIAVGALGSSASSSRSITSPAGGTPGAMPYPAGSAVEAKGGAEVRPCPVLGCSTITPVAAARAASAVGSTVSPATPPLATRAVAVRPADVDDTRNAFFGASGGTKSRGARGGTTNNISKNDSMPGKE